MWHVMNVMTTETTESHIKKLISAESYILKLTKKLYKLMFYKRKL